MASQSSLETKMEKFINVSFYAFIALGLILLFGRRSWWPEFYSPIFYGWVFLASASILILPKYIFKTRQEYKRGAVILLSAATALALILNGLGELYLYRLYEYGFQYDKLLHLLTTFLFAVVLTNFLEIWYGLAFKKALARSAAIVLVGGLLWENFEYFSDVLFKTSEFGIYGQYKFIDTAFDLLLDFSGVFIGFIFLLAPAKRRGAVCEYRHCPAVK